MLELLKFQPSRERQGEETKEAWKQQKQKNEQRVDQYLLKTNGSKLNLSWFLGVTLCEQLWYVLQSIAQTSVGLQAI